MFHWTWLSHVRMNPRLKERLIIDLKLWIHNFTMSLLRNSPVHSCRTCDISIKTMWKYVSIVSQSKKVLLCIFGSLVRYILNIVKTFYWNTDFCLSERVGSWKIPIKIQKCKCPCYKCINISQNPVPERINKI